MALTDRWLAFPADEELRRNFAEPEFDDASWEAITVPGHWRSTAAFSELDDPLLHRTRFEQPAGPSDRRWWLTFDGIYNQGDVWLDGAYLGDTEGWFAPHTFEVTEALRARSEHVLAVEVAGAGRAGPGPRRGVTGAFQDPRIVGPDWNPAGIWRPVHLVDTGPVRIVSLRATCTEATESRAVVSFSAELDAAVAIDVHVRTTVGTVDHGSDRPLAGGSNVVEWSVTIDRPTLWWPHALGQPHLESVQVEVRIADAAGSWVSDRRRLTTGLRTVVMDDWIVSVNGERLFCKGANLAPTRIDLAGASAADCERDIALARDAGLDLVRVNGHVALPHTYDAADRSGMLIWQDFPLQQVQSRTIRKQAVRQARQMVELLHHHPSIVLWCAHDEPMGPTPPPAAGRSPVRALARLARAQVPTWNTFVLDRSVARSLESADPSRPVVRQSGAPPRLPTLAPTDSHLWLGWEEGSFRDLDELARTLPGAVRFPSEFGAQSVPATDDFIHPERWPDLDWQHLESAHHLQRELLEQRAPAEGLSYAEWRDATQRYQAELITHHVETLRRLKYRPTGGFCQFTLADAHPGISWSVLDHDRVPKLGYAALTRACRPIIVVCDRPPELVAPGQHLSLAVHLVSDRRHDASGMVTVTMTTRGGSRHWSFAGDVEADSCVLVGTLDFVVPDDHGPLTIELTGAVGGEAIDNRYETIISAG